MIKQLHKLLFILAVITVFTSCTDTPEINCTYFGGKIINPKTNYVILYDYETVLDTFYLDHNDKFLGEIPTLRESLYYFKHGDEHQYIYLKPKDSLLIRLNTWDFDESLVFSGKGAKRNNLLIDCFLESEKDDRLFYSYYHLSPSNFRAKVDSIEQLKLARYNNFDTKNPKESEGYKDILKIALTYPLYTKVENYSMAHTTKKNHQKHTEVNREFYKHRDQIVLDKDSIMYFHAYRSFVVSHLYNKVNTTGHDISSNAFTVSLLKTIANEMKSELSRNAMLRQTVIAHFYRKSSCDVNVDAFTTYLNLTTNSRDKVLVSQLLSDTEKIHKGNKLENFTITDYNKTDRSIQSLIKGKNAVIYFWNPEFVSKDNIASTVIFLSNKYPELKFIGVKIDGDNIVKSRIKKLDIKSQYYLTPNSKANAFLTSKMPRTILVNKKGIVMNGYAALSSRNIYRQIKKLTKK
ncbi:MAG: hypothetical protein JKY02_04255 [Flavobacteriaceae bacterium]|nr:hypothetical protein [Flavobacteriaceae bacterium]